MEKNFKSSTPEPSILASEIFLGVNPVDLVQEYTIKKYIINFDSEISDPFAYRKIYDCLRKVKEEDEVHVVLNSGGGDLTTFVQLYNLLQECKGKTIAEIYTAYSCASFIALACDEIQVKEFASMMIHSMSYTNEGKLEEVTASNDFMRKWNSELTNKLLKGFMSAQEIHEVNNGKDFWFLNDEINKRLRKWVPIRKRKEINAKEKSTKKEQHLNGQ